jgi:hypothetical protein
MEVLANGFKANFWVPVEEEPDIDRFIDEQIMIDMDRFILIGILEKVSTCKKKNEEKEFEYFKQITVQVTNVCLASDKNFNIQIPGKKDEFLYEVKFRYANCKADLEPEPEEIFEGGADEVAFDVVVPVPAHLLPDDELSPEDDYEEEDIDDDDLDREPVGPEDADYLAEQNAANAASKKSVEDLTKEIEVLKAAPGDYEKQIATYERAIKTMEAMDAIADDDDISELEEQKDAADTDAAISEDEVADYEKSTADGARREAEGVEFGYNDETTPEDEPEPEPEENPDDDGIDEPEENPDDDGIDWG